MGTFLLMLDPVRTERSTQSLRNASHNSALGLNSTEPLFMKQDHGLYNRTQLIHVYGEYTFILADKQMIILTNCGVRNLYVNKAGIPNYLYVFLSGLQVHYGPQTRLRNCDSLHA